MLYKISENMFIDLMRKKYGNTLSDEALKYIYWSYDDGETVIEDFSVIGEKYANALEILVEDALTIFGFENECCYNRYFIFNKTLDVDGVPYMTFGRFKYNDGNSAFLLYREPKKLKGDDKKCYMK